MDVFNIPLFTAHFESSALALFHASAEFQHWFSASGGTDELVHWVSINNAGNSHWETRWD